MMSKKWNNYIAAAVGLTALLCLSLGVSAGYGVTIRLTPNDFRLLIGMAIVLVVVVVVTICLSMFVVAYSVLRRKEESEDDKRELALLRTAAGLAAPRRVSYNVMPPNFLPRQQPWRELPENLAIEYIEDNAVEIE